jgi:hypothetical protein
MPPGITFKFQGKDKKTNEQSGIWMEQLQSSRLKYKTSRSYALLNDHVCCMQQDDDQPLNFSSSCVGLASTKVRIFCV